MANRGLQSDGEDVAQASRKTAAQKAIVLERMLGLVAQYAPSLLRKDVMKSSTSLAWIWKRIRRHYGFVQSEANFMSLCEIKRKDDERYEMFFQRILAHIDEVMSPTTERLAVYLWLSLIDERLPAYIARVYAHDRSSSIMS